MSAKSDACAVLFSGGIDSTTVLYWARRRFGTVVPLTFDYGQRHRVEIQLVRRLLRRLGLEPVTLRVDLTQVGGSALTDRSIPVPRFSAGRLPASAPGSAVGSRKPGSRGAQGGPTKIETGRGHQKPAAPTGPPATYVPFRNGIFLAMAAAWAEARGVRDLACGFHVLDSPEYPDTRREFVRAMERAINLGTAAAAFGGAEARLRIHAPFIGKTKADIIRAGLALGADYSFSVSCYAGDEIPCGVCSSCRLRARGWKEAGREDPLLARLRKEGRL